MMKKVFGLLLTALVFWGTTVCAEELPPMITEAHYYTGILYYCDAEAGKVVLKEVNALGDVNQANTRTAVEAEYQEIPIVGPAIFKDKTELALSDCNYYPDSKVRVLITRDSQDVLRVVQMRFL